MGRSTLIRRRRDRGEGDPTRSEGQGDQSVSSSTIPPLCSDTTLRRALWSRRIAVFLLVLVLLAGLGGLLGQKTGTVSDTGSGATLEVEYPVITRPGLDSPWSVTVTRSGGFAGPVRLRTTSAYFDLFDENGFDPEPTASLQDDTWIEWEFAPPAGDTLAVGFDARLSPAIQSGAEATTELLDAGGETLASVTYRTRVAP